jgi:N utilization substance protein B
MTRRSRAREVALQLLFQFDSNPSVERSVKLRFVHDRLRDSELEIFCLSLFDGVQSHRSEIDKQLSEAADNWRLNRMAGVDRNVLRMGAFELMFVPDVPTSAAIDEAIELARRYGSKDSPSFVNGVLDRVARVRETEAPLDPSPASQAVADSSEASTTPAETH